MARILIGMLTIVAMTIGATRVLARPPYRKALDDYLGPEAARRLIDCRTCHLPLEPGMDSEDRPHNAFGVRLQELRFERKRQGLETGIQARIEAIAEEDSDGDGVGNLAELLNGSWPGDAGDRPTADPDQQARRLAEFRDRPRRETWSPFQSVRRPVVPRTREAAWARNPIDAFVGVTREAEGLGHRPEADRAILLRRLYLDLIGVPPTPQELETFRSDPDPLAYERVVDRLLEDPRHGERWARHWMDIWRYSDWAGWGEQVRDSQPHIWRWRDWIVESLNADRPYDRMVVEMLAADELAPEDPETLRATGYLARNFKLLSREKWMQDVVDHTGQAFLGVTLGCARCHDHMFDPILQKDYYQIRAVFEPHQVRIDRVPGQPDLKRDGLARAFDADPEVKTFRFLRGDDRTPDTQPLEPGVPESLGGSLQVEPVPLPRSAYSPETREFIASETLTAAVAEVEKARLDRDRSQGQADAGLAALEQANQALAVAEARLEAVRRLQRVEALVLAGQKDTESWRMAALATSVAQRALAVAEARLAVASAAQDRLKAVPAARAESDRAVASALRSLGQAEARAAEPASTAYDVPAVKSYPQTSTGRRLALARWITRPENPLTARVAVNHVWARHFGQGIVPSVSDFGRNGRPTTNPALLDWLAAEFVAQGWSQKALHRLIVTSATYRLASTPDRALQARDPDNVRLWRFTPRRAEAEVVRDSVLAVTGQLETRFGGPDIDQTQGLTVPRRSLYFRHAAEKQMEFLQIFDGAGVTECYQRRESVLPQQALALVNSVLTQRQARLLARQLVSQVGSDSTEFVTAAYERVLSRSPTPAELAECLAYLQTTPLPGTGWSGEGFDPGRPAQDPALRRRESLVHVLLNHHDFVTIR